MLGKNSNLPDDYTEQHATILKPMASAGVAVLIVDHLPKNRETAKAGATGTNAKWRTIGGVSLRVTVKTAFTPGQGGACYLRVLKDRHGGLRQHCAIEHEPLAGTFVMAQNGDSLSWSIDVPSEQAMKAAAAAEHEATMADVLALAALDPPPRSQPDVKKRMGWGSARAQAALTAHRALPESPEESPGRGHESLLFSCTPYV